MHDINEILAAIRCNISIGRAEDLFEICTRHSDIQGADAHARLVGSPMQRGCCNEIRLVGVAGEAVTSAFIARQRIAEIGCSARPT